MQQQAIKPERCGICAKTGGLVLGYYTDVNGQRVLGMTRCLHGAEVNSEYTDYQERRVGE